jgi:hypothetical protein
MNNLSNFGVGRMSLKKGDIRRLVMQKELLRDWSTLKIKIEAIRAQGTAGSIAADLVLACRIRGAVHHLLPEDNQFELERLFVGSMRAAALTFVEVRRANPSSTKPLP